MAHRAQRADQTRKTGTRTIGASISGTYHDQFKEVMDLWTDRRTNAPTNGRTDQRINRRKDQLTNQQTFSPCYEGASKHPKAMEKKSKSSHGTHLRHRTACLNMHNQEGCYEHARRVMGMSNYCPLFALYGRKWARI